MAEVRAMLHYTIAPPETNRSMVDPAKPADNGAADEATIMPVSKTLRNARQLSPQPTLASHGFQVSPHHTALSFEDFIHADKNEKKKENKIKNTYYPEIEALVCGVTGAAACVVLHHMIRLADSSAVGGAARAQGVAAAIHNDYSQQTSCGFYDAACPQEIRKQGNKQRFMVVNVWRSIRDGEAIRNNHLAMLDATTITAPDDFVPVEYNGAHTYRLDPSNHENHSWFYYPNMVKNEALLFTQFDSDTRKTCRYTFHTSFTDPTAPQDNRRASIEMRTICFFPNYERNCIPQLFSAGKDAVMRKAVAKLNEHVGYVGTHWPEHGKTWLRNQYWSGDAGKEKMVRWFITDQVMPKLGLRGQAGSEPLDKAQQDELTKIAMKPDSIFRRTLEAALPMPSADDKVKNAERGLVHSVTPAIVAQYWPAQARQWAKGCTQRGAFNEMIPIMVKGACDRSEHGLNPAVGQDVRAKIIAAVERNSQFAANCRASFK